MAELVEDADRQRTADRMRDEIAPLVHESVEDIAIEVVPDLNDVFVVVATVKVTYARAVTAEHVRGNPEGQLSRALASEIVWTMRRKFEELARVKKG